MNRLTRVHRDGVVTYVGRYRKYGNDVSSELVGNLEAIRDILIELSKYEDEAEKSASNEIMEVLSKFEYINEKDFYDDHGYGIRYSKEQGKLDILLPDRHRRMNLSRSELMFILHVIQYIFEGDVDVG